MPTDRVRRYDLIDPGGIVEVKHLTESHLAMLLAQGWRVVTKPAKRTTAIAAEDLELKAEGLEQKVEEAEGGGVSRV